MVGRRATIALVVLTALLLVGAAVAGYARSQLVDERAFSARATAALDDPSVRSVVAERVVDGIVQSTPDALTVRPLVTTAVSALIGTPTFGAVFRLAVRDVHGALINGRASVVMDLDRGGALLLDALRGVSPRAASRIPPDVAPRIADLEPVDRELKAARFLNDLADWFWPLLGATLLVGLACALTAGSSRTAIVRLGCAVTLAGATVAALVTGAGVVFVRTAEAAADIDDERERDALEALWSAFFGDLRSAAILAALAALLVAATAQGILAGLRRDRALRRARDLAASPTRGARLVRAAILLSLGTLLLLAPGLTGRALLVAVGLLLLVLGIGELSGREPGRAGAAARGERSAQRALAVAVALVVMSTVVAVALVLPAPKIEPVSSAAASGACNGLVVLCDRRLDEVVFPATHNSYAAADEPGWIFANHRHGIARQLQDGIRAFLVDIHFGVRDPASGRVRTDIEYEGASRNKVAAALSPEALATADRLVGRVGGPLTGRRRPWMCHTLCELGSEPLDEQLTIFKRYLDRNPREVVIMFVEPYVPAEEVERAMRSTGLLAQAAELQRDAPLPTLGELIDAGTRLVVFTEANGGARPWYLDGFSFTQDTPLAATGSSAADCERFRGTPDSPLLLLNHWDIEFPPAPSRNRRIGGDVLEQRIEACGRRRDMLVNMPAVDFYELTGMLEIVRRINARPR